MWNSDSVEINVIEKNEAGALESVMFSLYEVLMVYDSKIDTFSCKVWFMPMYTYLHTIFWKSHCLPEFFGLKKKCYLDCQHIS